MATLPPNPNPQDEAPLRWVVADHICRACFGRVMTRTTFDRRKVYRCSNCELEATGEGPQCLCCCGIKMRGTRDAGVRCVPNTQRRPENPAMIIAEQVQPPK